MSKIDFTYIQKAIRDDRKAYVSTLKGKGWRMTDIIQLFPLSGWLTRYTETRSDVKPRFHKLSEDVVLRLFEVASKDSEFYEIVLAGVPAEYLEDIGVEYSILKSLAKYGDDVVARIISGFNEGSNILTVSKSVGVPYSRVVRFYQEIYVKHLWGEE